MGRRPSHSPNAAAVFLRRQKLSVPPQQRALFLFFKKLPLSAIPLRLMAKKQSPGHFSAAVAVAHLLPHNAP